MPDQNFTAPDLRQSDSGTRVQKVRVRAVLSPMETPVRTASGVVTCRPLALIDLQTEGGVVGHAYVFTYSPVALKPVCMLIDGLGELLAGREVSPLAIEKVLRDQFRLLGDGGLVGIAVAGIEMACWDALAQCEGLPLARLLGGALRPVPAYMSVGMDGPAAAEKNAEQALQRGFKALKVKIGYPTLDEDLSAVQAAKAVLGRDAVLMVDYNQSLSEAEAVRRCRALDELDLAWIEEPILQADYAGHARIAKQIATSIQLGENWEGPREMAKAVEARASDLAMLDLMKIGGISGWLRAAHLAQAAGLPVSSHIFQEVTAHMTCVTPTAHWLEHMAIADPVLARPLRIEAGMAHPSDAIGSGIEWDEKAIARYGA